MVPIEIDPVTGSPIIKSPATPPAPFIAPSHTPSVPVETVHTPPVTNAAPMPPPIARPHINPAIPPVVKVSEEKAELQKKIDDTVKEYGQLSNIPITHEYWNWVNKLRSL